MNVIISYLAAIFICVGAPKPPLTPAETGAFAVAEIRDEFIDALWAFYQDWNIVRIRIKSATPFILENSSCFRAGPGTGLLYSINTQWNDTVGTYGLGPEECSADNTGSNWDPTIACSPQSANPFCLCVTPSSANLAAGGVYTCDPSQYQANPYTCEVGDLSGKYGPLPFNVSAPIVTLPPRTTTTTTTTPTTTTSTTTTVANLASLRFNMTLADLLRGAMTEVHEEAALSTTALFAPHSRNPRQSVQLTNGKDLIFRINRDPWSPPVQELRGKSISLQCVDRTRIACARLQYSDNVRFETARNEVLTRLARQRQEEGSENGLLISETLPKPFLRGMDAGSVEQFRPLEIVETIANSVVETLSNLLYSPKLLWGGYME